MRLILDASALIAGTRALEEEDCYTVRGAVDEVHGETAKLSVDLSIRDGSLKVVQPKKEALNKAVDAARGSGDIGHLSETDIELLALAIEFKDQRIETSVLTDDYAVQNLSKKLEILYVPVAEAGIKKYLRWKNICKGCGKRFPQEYKGKCDHCGSDVIRKVMGK
ncbi:MAG: hypothetical protein V3V92_01750 [Candidatus Hydrothermarchaeales archaeon]